MVQRYHAKNLYLCTVLIASLASITAGLSLEELSLEIKQLKENNEELSLQIRQLKHNDISAIKETLVAKDTQLKELQKKVQHLETKLTDQEKECQKKHDTVPASALDTADLFGKQVNQRNAIFRTCKELHQADPSLNSGMYWIDPDGQGVGDDPIYVDCDMTTGKTSVLHDSEDPTDVGHCADPGCYTRPIKYLASTRQMDALSELSSECHQSIRYDCNYAPLETNGVAHAWWNDRNGVAQYFWAGSNNSIHTCQCGIDHNCIELYNFCNCDSAAPVPLNDSGVITDKSYLPVTRLNFGRTQLETSSGVHTLGRFECSGQVSISGMPMSCSDLWKIGHTLSGIYSIMGFDYVEIVYCDFTRLSYDQGYQTLIGYSDVKSWPIYFYVQKNVSHNGTGSVPFELTRLNVGGAMNASSGIFTAPQNGVYSFTFTASGYFPASTSTSITHAVLMLNDVDVGRGHTHTNDDDSYYTHSLHSILELKKHDEVWINIESLDTGTYLFDNEFHYTHFTGHLLQENVASSLRSSANSLIP